ncbi:MAG: hypothetical protein J6A69_12595 [Clostridia bacterium]|nr:hypothetical protein [Clostridia bacterium]
MVNSSLINKRLTIFAGHYGSGKTNIAVNWAIYLAQDNKNVAIADLDIVNPYFRTKDSADILEEKGIRLISSPFANTNVDTPALPAEAYAVLEKDVTGIIDVGGDDRGALALGRYTPAILKENNYEMLFVINKFRPLTRTADDCIAVMSEIEEAAKIKFTGIVNNSNLGDITTAEDIFSSFEYAREVSEKTGLEIKMTTVKESIFGEVSAKCENAFPIKLYVKQSWSRE